MDSPDKHELGGKIGDIIVLLVDLIAMIDNVTREEVLDEIFTEWWMKRISDE